MPGVPEAAIAAFELAGEFFATEVIGKITIGNILAATFVVGSALDQRRRARHMAADARAGYLASMQDRSVMVRSAIAPRNMVYGYDQVSGPIADIFRTGDLNQFLHLIIPVAGRQVADIEAVYLNEYVIPTASLDADGFVTGAGSPWVRGTEVDGLASFTVDGSGAVTLPVAATRVTSVTQGFASEQEGTVALTGWAHTAGTASVTGLPVGASITVLYVVTESKSRVRIHKFLGAPGQTVPTALLDETAGRRTSAHVGEGIAWLWVRLEWDSAIFGTIGLPNISALVKGHLVRDPRTGATGWTDNSALCAADYALDQTLGLRCAAAQVPDAELAAQANIADELVVFNVGGNTQKRYTCNGMLSAGDGRLANFDALLESMSGHAVWTQGRWRIQAGHYATPEPIVITADHLGAKPPAVQRRPTRRELFNAVRATYRDPATNYTEQPAPVVVNATYEAQDGGRRITEDVSLGMVQDPMRAQRLAKIVLERARQAVTVQLQCNLRAYDLLPGQVVLITLARYGWTSKPFEIRRREVDLAVGTVDYQCRETAASVWAWAYGEATTVDTAPDTDLPSPFEAPPSLGVLTIQSGSSHLWMQADGVVVSRARVSWAASAEQFVLQGGRIQVQWCEGSAGAWQTLPPLPGDAVSTYLAPVPDKRVIAVRVRQVNAAGRAGPWSAAVHDVVGKSAAPGGVAGLVAAAIPGGVQVGWAALAEADYMETEVRQGASWAAGVVLYKGRAGGFVWPWPAAGTYSIRAKHRDSSGIESAADSAVSVVVGANALIGTTSIVAEAVTKVYDFAIVVGPISQSTIT